jgi:hypothetical protein
MKKPNYAIIWIGTLLLIGLHQDSWFWDDHQTLIFGFLPVGLAYHAAFSIVAAIWWGSAMVFAWPHDLEALAEEEN